jgi:hypothetical protein
VPPDVFALMNVKTAWRDRTVGFGARPLTEAELKGLIGG